MAAELKPGRCKKIDSTWQHEESPSDSTSPLFLSPLALSLSLSTDPPPVSLVPNEQQLARLTDYVAFLEN